MSENSSCQVAVCLLTYNHEAVIRSTLQSILNQSLRNYELLVSDDCSTDGTWPAILELAANNPRIRAIRTPKNLGMAANANFAIDRTNAPLIALLHHDDIYREDLLEKWSRVMLSHSDIGFVFNSYAVHESTRVYGHPFTCDRIDGLNFLDRDLLPKWGCPVRGTAMIRRSLWVKVGGMRTQFGLLADVDLWMRLAAAAPVGYVPEPVIAIRQERPAYYPQIYTSWSWKRQRLLYDIHADNYRNRLNFRSVFGRYQWLKFRLRLNFETLKWLAYAVAKRRMKMIATSNEAAGVEDFLLLRLIRQALRAAAWLFRPLLR